MKQSLIVGQTNVGKTLFLLNFAEYLGLRQVEVDRQAPSGETERLSLSLPAARRALVHTDPHTTRSLQSTELRLPAGKQRRPFLLVDSTGLTDGIHENEEVRHAMAQTLELLQEADLILHMLDAARVGGSQEGEGVSEVDRQIARYAIVRSSYAILANKMDLPRAKAGLLRIQEAFPHQRVIPVSALKKIGFREVKSFVWDRL